MYYKKIDTGGIIAFTILTLLVLLNAGCSTTSPLCTVPESKDSKICALSDRFHVTPEYLSQGLLALNFAAIKKDIYTPERAYKFVERLKKDVKDIRARGQVWTVSQAINFVDEKLDVLPPDIKAAFNTFAPADFTEIEMIQPVTDYDFELFIRHLEKQLTLIRIYL